MPVWLKTYHRSLLTGDIAAGIVVALMLVPQGMAYALVAGLPAVSGLYASIAPALAYACFGSSMTQSVGPQAMTALLTATVLTPLAVPGSAEYVALAAQLALFTGVLLALGGLLRAGFLAHFLSQPVLSGFTNGAVCLIAAGQLTPLFGRTDIEIHLPSALLGVACISLLFAARRYLAAVLRGVGISARAAESVARLAPLAVLLLSAAVLTTPQLAQTGIARIGSVPRGLPDLGLVINAARSSQLVMPAMLMAFIVFLQSISAAQTLARRRAERIDGDRELIGLGAANIAGALSGGFPVTGSISRSAVNHEAGARTPMAGVVAALLLTVALVAPTGWLALLPLPAMAATIIAAVFAMFDWHALRGAWHYERGEGVAHLVTFGGVIALGVERGIMLGIVLSLALLIWRASRPPIVEVGRQSGTNQFRNAARAGVETLPALLMLRIDQGLFFGNAAAVVERVEAELASRTALRHVVLLMSAVNGVDYSAATMLIELDRDLSRRGVQLHLTDLKDPVLATLRRRGLPKSLQSRIQRRAAQVLATLEKSPVSGTDR